MISVPAFPLPSDINKVIQFRAPTVRDSMAIADLNPDLEEAATTQYLNNQQDAERQGGQTFDSRLWTGEDRRTALWWMFIATQTDPTLSYRFEKNGEEHYVDLDLRDLGETATTLSIKPEVEITFTVKGVEHKGLVKPLNGYALEQIEVSRVQRNELKPGSAGYRRMSNRIAMQELVYSLSVMGEPEDREQAEEYRFNLVMDMDLDEEYRPLFAKITQAKRQLQHGLATSYKDGIFLMVANIELKEGEGKKPLMFPFQANNFLPTL